MLALGRVAQEFAKLVTQAVLIAIAQNLSKSKSVLDVYRQTARCVAKHYRAGQLARSNARNIFAFRNLNVVMSGLSFLFSARMGRLSRDWTQINLGAQAGTAS